MESLQLKDIKAYETKSCKKSFDCKIKPEIMIPIELHTINTSWIEPVKTQESRYDEMIKKTNMQFIECSANNNV